MIFTRASSDASSISLIRLAENPRDLALSETNVINASMFSILAGNSSMDMIKAPDSD
jgi:uncharacterized protein YkvS